MDWLERMKNVMTYIEEHITDDLNAQEIAGLANSSEFHFQRVFCILTGYTLKDYIRKRRLTLAAAELVSSNKGILEIAIKYGYESQASFTKAFSRLHGLSPGAVGLNKQPLRAFPPISFHISINGGVTMDYEIKDYGEFEIIGKTIAVTSKDGENFKIVPKFWQDVMADKSFDSIMALAEPEGVTRGGAMGVCMDFSDDSVNFNYLIACESKATKLPKTFVKRTIPAHRWAIFRVQGPLPESIQSLWKRIFSEWFPATQYIHAKGPELEVYPPSENPDDPDCCKSEVWIPIEK